MRVSVVICTYAEEMYEHFEDCLASVQSQTYPDVEIVVVVDGTRSLYERIVEDYGDASGLTLHCNEENVGLLESRNKGAEIATGEVVAFIDDDAVADERWIGELVAGYEEQDALAVGGQMTPAWVAGKPSFLPEEFYWLVGVTHRGFADGPGYVRNTFGSNISFRRDVFLDLGGFDTAIGGRKGEKNLQGGETELCARLRDQYDESVWYTPDAEVAHKVFEYRTDPIWLLKRAFWQGYSKRAMETFVPDAADEESAFLSALLVQYLPAHLKRAVTGPSVAEAVKAMSLLILTGMVGLGYGYGVMEW